MSVERTPRTPGSRRTPLTTARSVGWLSIVVVVGIGLLRLVGGLLHVTLLTSVAPSWIEMKVITLVCFLLSAGALALIYLQPAARRSTGAMLMGGLIALVGLATIADYASHLVIGQAAPVTEAPFLNLFFAAHTRMALITACVFTLVGFALVLLAMNRRRAANVAHALTFPAVIASYVVPVSYLLGVQSMSAVLGTAMALNTGLAFCSLCLAVFCARTDTWLMRAFTGDEIGAYMARRLLPALMATPLVVGWFRLQGERSGLFSSEVGVALVASTYTIVFVILVWLAARAGNRTDERRRAAERATRVSEERLNRAQEIAHLGSWQLDLVSNRLTWSDEVYRIFGLRPQEFEATYEAFLAVVHPDDRAEVDVAYSDSVRDDRDGYEIEHRVVRRDTGEVRIVLEKCEHFHDSSGRIIRSVGMVHDITERKRAEEGLRESEANFRIVADNTHDFEFWISPDRRYVYVSPSCERVTGYKPAEFLADPELRLKVVHPEDRQRVLVHDRDVEHARSGVMDYRITHRDGSIRWIGHVCQPIFDSGGKFLGTRGSNRDITERKRAESELRASEEKFASAFRSAPYALSLSRPQDGRVIDVNESFCEISGYSRDEVVGKTAAELSIWENSADRSAVVEELSRTGRLRNKEFRFRVKSGRIVIGLFNAELVQLADQPAILSTISDITERKQAEMTLRESEERLRKLYSAMSEGLVLHQMVYDDSGKAIDYCIIDVNPAFEAITGLSRANAVGRLASELYGTGGPPYIDTYARVAETAVPEDFETEFAPMAKCFHISVFSPGKGIFATVFSDITARKQTERKLAEQAAMLASANDAIIGYDAAYRVTFWNQGAEKLYGWREDEVLGQVGSEFLRPVYVGVTREQLIARIVADGHIETESIRTTRDGRQRSVEAHVIALRDEQGRTTGYVSVDRDITERKQAEDELRRSNSFNQSIIDSSSDCIKLLDVEGRLAYMSPAGQRLLGIRDLTAYLNVPYEEFWKGSDRQAVTEVIGKARLGQSGSFQGFCPTVDGEPRWWDVSITPVLGADGKPERLLAVSRDISERRRAEQTLCEAKENLEVRVRERTAELAAEVEERKRAEERLAATSQYVRSLIESSLDPLVTISADGKVTDVNEATVKVTGVPREQLVGDDFSDYFTEPEKAREGYRRVFAEGFVTDYPLTIRHRDGHLTDVLYNASVYRDTRGVIVGVFAAARDVTDRKRAEAAVAEERQRFQDVLNMLPAYVILISPDYKVPFANRFFEERFGKSGGFRCFEYLFHRSEPCENCETMKVLTHKGPHHWEWLGPDGRNYDIYDFPFADVDGSPLIMEMGIDITEQKRAEQALQKARDTLEVRVAERTAELKRSNEELEQFAYVASHDLQQPLRMVASYVELLGQRYKGRLDEKADKYIAYASGGAVRMSQLVNDLLAFSRVGTRAAPLVPVSLDRVVAQARENLTVAIEQSGAKVKVGPLPTVSGDETQLVQLFQNLFDNAIKFRGAALPEVSVSCRDAGDNWECAVRDNGIGIEPKHAERIFGLFKRLHTEEEYPGTGIGLAVCKKIVERHGGAIYVEPAEGGGAVFRVTLPKQPAAANEENHE